MREKERGRSRGERGSGEGLTWNVPHYWLYYKYFISFLTRKLRNLWMNYFHRRMWGWIPFDPLALKNRNHNEFDSEIMGKTKSFFSGRWLNELFHCPFLANFLWYKFSFKKINIFLISIFSSFFFNYLNRILIF